MTTMRNSVQLIGRLGKDVELREFASEKKMARVTLATNDWYRNKDGEKVEETQWHTIVAWGKNAEAIANGCNKGDQILVKGKLIHRNYEGNDGVKRYVSEVVVREFMKLSKTAKAEMVEEV